MCEMAPPIHLGAWSIALLLWLPFVLWKKSASVPAVTPVTVVLPNTRHITRVCTFYMHTQYYKCLLRAEITACAHTLTAC